MNHSPRLKTDVPNHDDMNTPTKKMNVIEVTNPRPSQEAWANIQSKWEKHKYYSTEVPLTSTEMPTREYW